MPLIIDGEPIGTCPVKLLRGSNVWDVIQLYTFCEMMHALPVYSGGVMDQSSSLMQAFQIIHTAVNKPDPKDLSSE